MPGPPLPQGAMATGTMATESPLGRFGRTASEKRPIPESLAAVLPPFTGSQNNGESEGGLLWELSGNSMVGAPAQNCFVEVADFSKQNLAGHHDNEDRVMSYMDKIPDSDLGFYVLGVCDGHDTAVASDLVSRLLPQEVSKFLKLGSSVTEAYTKAMSSLEEQLRSVTASAGTCVLSCTIARNCVYCANLGDCRAVLVSLAVPRNLFSKTKSALKPKVLSITWMSEDHTASQPDEEARILKAGGRIVKGRVGGLEPSRSLGDFDVKANNEGVISIVPEVRRHQFVPDGSTPAQAVLICACDGIWDVLTGQDVCNLIVARSEISDLQTDMTAGFAGDTKVLKDLAEDLVEFSIAKGSADDCTAVVALISVPGDPTACETPSNAGMEPDTPMIFGRKFGY